MEQLYSKLPNLIFGFHGCDMSTFEDVMYRHQDLKFSANKYDWLGNGIYFWENSFSRAYEWAENRSGSSDTIHTPAAVGAVIDLGRCLNLTDYGSSDVLKKGYEILTAKCKVANIEIPKNKVPAKSGEMLLRDLDCAVIQQIHEFREEMGLEPYDSVRGVFIECGPAYEGSGFMMKTHIQLCIINPNCIKGYFKPKTTNSSYMIP